MLQHALRHAGRWARSNAIYTHHRRSFTLTHAARLIPAPHAGSISVIAPCSVSSVGPMRPDPFWPITRHLSAQPTPATRDGTSDTQSLDTHTSGDVSSRLDTSLQQGDLEAVVRHFTDSVARGDVLTPSDYACVMEACNAAHDYSTTRTIFSYMIDHAGIEPSAQHLEELAFAWSASDNPTEAMDLLFKVMPHAGLSPTQGALEDIFSSICLHAEDLATVQASLDTLVRMGVAMNPPLFQSLMTSVAVLSSRNPVQSTLTREAWNKRLDQVWSAAVAHHGDDLPYETHVHYIAALNTMNRFKVAHRHLAKVLEDFPDREARSYPGADDEYPIEFSSTLRACARAPRLDTKFFERTLALAARHGVPQSHRLLADVRRALPEMAHQDCGRTLAPLEKMKEILAYHRDNGWPVTAEGYNDVMRLCALMDRKHKEASTELIDASLAQARHDGVPLFHTAYIAYLRHGFNNRRLEGVELGLSMLQEEGITLSRGHTYESFFRLLRFRKGEKKCNRNDAFQWISILRRVEEMASREQALTPDGGFALIECYEQFNASSDVMRVYAYLRNTIPREIHVKEGSADPELGFLLPPRTLSLVSRVCLNHLLYRESMDRGRLNKKGEWIWSRGKLETAIETVADLWNDVLRQGKGSGVHIPADLLIARIHAAGFAEYPDPGTIKRLASRTMLGKYGVAPDHRVINALVHHLARVGETAVALRIASEMPQQGLRPNVDTWTGIATGIAAAHAGTGDETSKGSYLRSIGELVITMQEAGHPPNEVFVERVLDYLSSSPRDFKRHTKRFALLLQRACGIDTMAIRDRTEKNWQKKKAKKNAKDMEREKNDPRLQRRRQMQAEAKRAKQQAQPRKKLGRRQGHPNPLNS